MARQLGRLGAAGALAGALSGQASAGHAGAGLGCTGAGRWAHARAERCDTTTGACDMAGPLPRHGRGPGHDTAPMRACWTKKTCTNL